MHVIEIPLSWQLLLEPETLRLVERVVKRRIVILLEKLLFALPELGGHFSCRCRLFIRDSFGLCAFSVLLIGLS